MNHILFPITYQCNLSCKFCCAKPPRNVNITKCVDEIKAKSGVVEWVYITGGEPFIIGNELFSVCDKLRNIGFKVGVTTNGTFFRPEIADHVNRLGVSLDGDEGYHDAYRGEGVFEKAVSLLRAVRGKCETVVMSVYFRDNEDALLRLRPIIEAIDPTFWQIQRDVMKPDLKIPHSLQ